MKIQYKAKPVEGWKYIVAHFENSRGKLFFTLIDKDTDEMLFPLIFHNGVKKSDRHILSILYKTVVYDLSVDKNGKPLAGTKDIIKVVLKMKPEEL